MPPQSLSLSAWHSPSLWHCPGSQLIPAKCHSANRHLLLAPHLLHATPTLNPGVHWLALLMVVGCLVSLFSLVSTWHHKHKGQSYIENTFCKFMPNVTLFLDRVYPKQTKTNLLKRLVVLKTNIPFSISANTKRRLMQQVQLSSHGELWSLWSPGQSIGHPASELGTPWPRYPRAQFITLSQTKVSLEFLPWAWKKAVRRRCFRLKSLDSNQHFSAKLGSIKKFPKKFWDQTPLELFQNNAI